MVFSGDFPGKFLSLATKKGYQRSLLKGKKGTRGTPGTKNQGGHVKSGL